MNLLDSKKIIERGGLVLCTALLFLFSCEDDITLGLPFDPDDENIRIIEKEFILPSSVVLLEPVNTTNRPLSTNSPRPRILAGSYQHEALGKVAATSFTNFSRTSTVIPADAVYDSAVLVLQTNYWYGLISAPAISGLSVHLLQEVLPVIETEIDTLQNGTIDTLYNYKTFYANDKVPFNMESIGQATFSTDPDKEKNEVHVMLDNTFGADLFTKIKDKDDAVSNNEKLQSYFKGFAMVMEGTPHMLGFDHAETKLYLYHHTASTDSLRYTLETSPTSSSWFTNIESDRSGTSLAGLTVPLQDFDPGDGNVYLQSGTGIVPKIDFAPFVNFINSTGEKVVINQAEFSIEIDFPGEFLAPPSTLQPFLVKDDNKLIVVVDQFGTASFKTIQRDLSGNTNNSLVLQPDTVENTTTIAYRGTMTSYTEDLIDGDVEKDFLLYPGQLSTSINHLITDSSRVKLKIYYTTLK